MKQMTIKEKALTGVGVLAVVGLAGVGTYLVTLPAVEKSYHEAYQEIDLKEQLKEPEKETLKYSLDYIDGLIHETIKDENKNKTYGEYIESNKEAIRNKKIDELSVEENRKALEEIVIFETEAQNNYDDSNVKQITNYDQNGHRYLQAGEEYTWGADGSPNEAPSLKEINNLKYSSDRVTTTNPYSGDLWLYNHKKGLWKNQTQIDLKADANTTGERYDNMTPEEKEANHEFSKEIARKWVDNMKFN